MSPTLLEDIIHMYQYVVSWMLPYLITAVNLSYINTYNDWMDTVGSLDIERIIIF